MVSAYRHDLAQLCRQFHVRRLELFGSAALGTFNPGRSDLDFLVEFEELPTGQYAAFLAFKDALEHLFGVSIDLVVPSAVRSPYFRQSLQNSKALLYAA
jgi:uncharacterized protein